MIEFDLFFSNTYMQPQNTSYPNRVTIKGEPEVLRYNVSRSDYAFASYKNGKTKRGTTEIVAHRCNNDFMWCNTLYIDIDNDKLCYTLNDFRNDFKDHEYYIQTSKSHQVQKDDKPAKDRFHAIFPIGVKIIDSSMLKRYLQLLHMMSFKDDILDKNCIDSARFFLGFKDTIIEYNQGTSILEDIKRFEETLPIKTNPDYSDLKVPHINSGLKNIILLHLKKASEAGEFDDYNSWIGIGFSMKKLGFSLEEYQYISKKDAHQAAEEKWNSIDLNEIEASPLHLLSYARKYGSAAKW